MALGSPLEPGQKAYIFRYNPNSLFYVQSVEIINHRYEDGDGSYDVKITSELVGTVDDDDRYSSGKEVTVPEGLIKSRPYVKNVLGQHGKQLIEQIFERMFK